jgi:hypothetical protein
VGTLGIYVPGRATLDSGENYLITKRFTATPRHLSGVDRPGDTVARADRMEQPDGSGSERLA